jgi:DNA-binding transcriptional LysR family regulator
MRLNLTQPAVSQQLKELESRLGVSLLERIGRRVQLTSAGQEMLLHARDLLDRARIAEEAMARYRHGRLGRVRLGADGTLCAFVLPPILRALLTAHPDLEPVIEAGPSPVLAHKVVANELDIAFTAKPPVIEPILEVETIVSDELLAFWPDTLGAAPERVTPQSLDGRPFVGFSPGNMTYDLVQHWFDAGGARPSPVMYFDMGMTIAAIVAAGLGAAILPPEARLQAEVHGNAVVRPLDPPIRRTLVTMTRRDKLRTPALRVLQQALSTLAKDKTADDSG